MLGIRAHDRRLFKFAQHALDIVDRNLAFAFGYAFGCKGGPDGASVDLHGLVADYGRAYDAEYHVRNLRAERT